MLQLPSYYLLRPWDIFITPSAEEDIARLGINVTFVDACTIVRTQKRSNARAIRPAHFCCCARVNRTARANYCTSMRYIKLHKAHVGKISGTPCCSSIGCALMLSLTIVLVYIFPPFVKKKLAGITNWFAWLPFR